LAVGFIGEEAKGVDPMQQTVTVILSVGRDRVDEFERGFREHELPVWQDLLARQVLVRASLSPLEITTSGVEGAQQYMVVAVFASEEGHHEHDNHPGFEEWHKIADRYQVAGALAYGGDTILSVGD
jgi:hypothetical protein